MISILVGVVSALGVAVILLASMLAATSKKLKSLEKDYEETLGNMTNWANNLEHVVLRITPKDWEDGKH